MPTAWRLVRAAHAATAFDGEGAGLTGGRWNSIGVRMVYTADMPSTAVLEILVQDVRAATLLRNWVIIKAGFPDGVVTHVDPATLPPDWSTTPAPATVRAIGDQWIASRASLVLQVPSAIVPLQYNFLINPDHPAFATHLTRSAPQPFDFNPRLLAKLK